MVYMSFLLFSIFCVRSNRFVTFTTFFFMINSKFMLSM